MSRLPELIGSIAERSLILISRQFIEAQKVMQLG